MLRCLIAVVLVVALAQPAEAQRTRAQNVSPSPIQVIDPTDLDTVRVVTDIADLFPKPAPPTPLIDDYLREASHHAFNGDCRGYIRAIARASDALGYYQRFISELGPRGEVTSANIRTAQRALDAIKKTRCVPTVAETVRLDTVASLPAPPRSPPMEPFAADQTLGEQAADLIRSLEYALQRRECPLDLSLGASYVATLDQLEANARSARDWTAMSDIGDLSPVEAQDAYARLHYQAERGRELFEQIRIACAGLPDIGFPPFEDADFDDLPQIDLGGLNFDTGYDIVPLDDTRQAMLDGHNAMRVDFGLPKLRWDYRLEMMAQDYADSLRGGGRIPHSPRQGREEQRENLLITNRGYRSPSEMIETFTAELQFYKPGFYPDIAINGNWVSVSHFSQLAWPYTSHVGCAVSSDTEWDYTVCRYTAPGNRDGNLLWLDKVGD